MLFACPVAKTVENRVVRDVTVNGIWMYIK